MAPASIVPVILSGGTGTRLWPLSREARPKQLQALASPRTMIQETALRVAQDDAYAPPIVVCNEAQRFVVAEQLREAGVAGATIVLEPTGRGTAAAAAIGALLARKRDPDARVLLLPADHHVVDPKTLNGAFAAADAAARDGALVTFGVRPTAPETGYGYILAGEDPDGDGVADVAAFVEKPDRARAETFLEDGRYFWNSGMFLFRADAYLAELERFAPGNLAACATALEDARRDLDFLRLGTGFADQPNASVDVAVMERTDRAAVAPLDCGWTDVGSWSALWEVGAKDADGNVAVGDVVLHGAHNCYARSDGPLTAVLGLDDVVVVSCDDAVLVSSKDHAQDVKAIVERLKADGRAEASIHREVHRPWGSYRTLFAGERFQVKCIDVKPGAKLSLQKHYHRAEHWVVVNGTALVTRDNEMLMVRENESVYLPLGAVHRLENPGKILLRLVEVQSGPYLGEDDIVRLDDDYRRI